MVDGRPHPFGGERLAVVRSERRRAGPSARAISWQANSMTLSVTCLGLADAGDLLRRPCGGGRARPYPDRTSTAMPAWRIRSAKINGSVRSPTTARDARAAQALGRRLGRGRLAIAGKSALGREVGGAGDFVDAGVLAGPLHLDVAEDQQRLPPPVGVGRSRYTTVSTTEKRMRW